MPNRRQIRFLHWQRLADGTSVAHWKPSPRLRRLGWTNRKCGTSADEAGALAMALAFNAELDAWEEQRRGAPAGQPAPAAPRRWTFGDCVAAYRQSSEYRALASKTREEYEVRLRWLTRWAEDGALPLDQLDAQMLRDLKDALLAPAADGTLASLHRAGAIMRVLRLLLNWAIAQGRLGANPASHIRIPTAKSRGVILLPSEIDRAADAAELLGFPSVALGFVVGLWTLQRESDLLAITRMAYRAIDNVEPADAAVLAGAKGQVMGLRLRQRKTGAWVDCPVPPFLHGPIEQAFERSQFLLPDDNQPTRACPHYLFRRRARKALAEAGLEHAQFRDTRRSGMTMLSDLGAPLPGITAISGHMIFGRRSILDTYMPGNTRAACAAMAMALRTRHQREARESDSNAG